MRQSGAVAYGRFDDEASEAGSDAAISSVAASSGVAGEAEVEFPEAGPTEEKDVAEDGAEDKPQPPPDPAHQRQRRRRLLAAMAFFVALVLSAKLAGLEEYVDRERVRLLVRSAGAWGWLAYVAVFALGELLHVPGVVFVAAAIYSYGRLAGGCLAYVGSMGSVCTGFLVSRRLSGGATLEAVGLPVCVQSRLEGLVAAPVRTTIVLRLFCYLSPAMNVAMGVTGVKFRSYVLGSAIGLVPMTVLVTLALDALLGPEPASGEK